MPTGFLAEHTGELHIGLVQSHIAGMTPMKVLYIHGFGSVGSGLKVSYIRSFAEVISPDLSHQPAKAMAQLESIIQQLGKQHFILVGASLGGYYANFLACKYKLGAVLINPLVDPQDLRPYLGININFGTGKPFDFTEADLGILETLASEPGPATLVILAEDDEVLDYRKAVTKYENSARIELFKDNDHRFDVSDINLQALCESIWADTKSQ